MKISNNRTKFITSVLIFWPGIFKVSVQYICKCHQHLVTTSKTFWVRGYVEEIFSSTTKITEYLSVLPRSKNGETLSIFLPHVKIDSFSEKYRSCRYFTSINYLYRMTKLFLRYDFHVFTCIHALTTTIYIF